MLMTTIEVQKKITRPGTTCAQQFRGHLAARGRETNICRVYYFSAGASKGVPWLRRVRGSAGVL